MQELTSKAWKSLQREGHVELLYYLILLINSGLRSQKNTQYGKTSRRSHFGKVLSSVDGWPFRSLSANFPWVTARLARAKLASQFSTRPLIDHLYIWRNRGLSLGRGLECHEERSWWEKAGPGAGTEKRPPSKAVQRWRTFTRHECHELYESLFEAFAAFFLKKLLACGSCCSPLEQFWSFLSAIYGLNCRESGSYLTVSPCPDSYWSM